MLVLNLPFKALMFLTLMRPSLVLFLVLWLKLVKDFLKVRCRLALLPFLISCLIWLDLVASLPLIKERILVIILLLHFLSLMLGSVLVYMDLAAKGLGAKEWNNSLKTKLSLLPKKLFRIRMSRNFGMKMLTMTNLSTECLIQLTKLGYDATPFNQILKQNAKREMRLRLGKVTVADVLAAQPVTTNLLKFMRASIKMIGVSNLQSFIASMTQKLTLSDISDESKNYLDKAGITTACLRIKSKWTAGGK